VTSCLVAWSYHSRSPQRPWSRGQRHSPHGSLSRALIVFSARPPLLRRARALASRYLRPSDSTQCCTSFPASPSSCWLRLPSFGKPALPSPSRAHLVGAPPWSPVSWPGSVVLHFFSFLFQKLRLVVLMLVGIFFRQVSDQRCRRSAAHHRRAAIREGKVLRVRNS